MAARVNKTTLHDEWRAKIQTSALINRLTQFVNGEVKMTPAQVRAAEILMKKTLPDLSNVQLTGKDGERLIPDSVKVEFIEGRENTDTQSVS